MRLRRSKRTPDADTSESAPAPPTAVQPAAGGDSAQPAAPSRTDAGPPAATSGPGPVRGLDPDAGPRPPITGTHPVASPPAAPEPEGQRAWLTDLDRRLGTRTYAGAAAMVLSLAASIVAIVLAIDARDNSAGVDDLTRVESQLLTLTAESAVGRTALDAVNELASRLSTLEDRVDELAAIGDGSAKRITVVEDDIDDLRQQISDLGTTTSSAASGATNATP